MHAPDKVRIDKWLWAARFFKTRSLACTAVEAGHVQINGERIKPARHVRVGDMVRVLNQSGEFDIEVLELAELRGPAAVAATLYHETEASVAKRQLVLESRKLEPQFDHPDVKGRPTKKWRRQLHFFERNNGR